MGFWNLAALTGLVEKGNPQGSMLDQQRELVNPSIRIVP